MGINRTKDNRPMNTTDQPLTIAILNAEYEELKAIARAKGFPCRVTMTSIAKKHGIPLTTFLNYRKHHIYRRTR